jgi:hypothetical protein
MHKTKPLFLALPLLMSGCANFHVAQNADEFRSDVIKDPRYKHEQYEVNRSFSKVAKTLKEKSEQCLNYSIDRIFSYRAGSATGANVSHITYSSTFKRSENNAELYVQMDISGDAALMYTPPKGGIYTLVADLEEKSTNTTQVELYYGSYKAAILPTAVKNWIDGKTEGCPDLKADIASGRE